MSTASQRAWFERHRQVNTWVLPHCFEALKKAADNDGVTLSAKAREILEDYVTYLAEAKRKQG